ncbi:Retinol dehydrogenase 12 [Mycena venus]|uniref:Retinol dehydrogenase 12 n=1 Tax=Mycena venus TaxID=2733690 RepID=A0A8H7CXT4_9AGAR|nr:Retinol dehydrogenase 12 [Mycena venus]
MDMNATLGAIEIGTLLSGVLFGLITAQTYVYFKNFPRDSRFMKGLVFALWIVEMAHTACIFDALYMYTITAYGNPTSLIKFPISLDVTIVLHGTTVIIVQLFFTHRMSKFLKNKYYIPVILSVGAVLLVRFIAFLVSGVAAVRMSTLLTFMQSWKSLILFDLLSCAITDVIISAILVYQLAIRRASAYKSTIAIMDKLIMWAVETCLVTTFTTMVMLVCFLTMKQNFIWVGILLVQPKIFSNALLANLNSRTGFRDHGSVVQEFSGKPNSHQMICFKPGSAGVTVSQETATIKDDLPRTPGGVHLVYSDSKPKSSLTDSHIESMPETKENSSMV